VKDEKDLRKGMGGMSEKNYKDGKNERVG